MNRFYEQPKYLIWIESILLLFIGLFLALIIIEKGDSQPLIYLTLIIYVPISQFLFTPFFKITGVYKYYSPMLLGYMANNKQIDLHSGTSFDHLFVLRKCKPGTPLRNKLMIYHLEGLLQLIDLIEKDLIPESVNISGTSYFFNDRTINKLGFEIETPTNFYRINLFLNFIDLCWMYSLSRGTFSIPNIWDAKKASIQGGHLLAQKTKLKVLQQSLISKQNVLK